MYFFIFASPIQLGSEKIVQLLVRNGANVNIMNEDKFSALHLAALEGYIPTNILLEFIPINISN